MKHKNVLFILLLIFACVIWCHNILLFVNSGHKGKPAKKAVTAAIVEGMYTYKADFPDPFFCKQFMPEKQAATGRVVSGRKKESPVYLPPCKIGGIVYNASNPMALFISGGKSQLVKKGDVVDSITIKKILQDSVEVVFRGKRFLLGK
jgi:hypothetical protein